MPGFVHEAQRMLRDGTHFHWSTVALLAIAVYVYNVEVERKRLDIVFAGLAFWLMDWINEIANALVLHFSDRAPLWTETGPTAYQIFIGLNVETMFMFLIGGVAFAKVLPADRKARILGLPNRPALILGFSVFSVAVEVFIHLATTAFHWEYWWWGWPWGLPAIVIFGYATFFAMAVWVHDMGDDHRRQARVVGALATIVVGGIVVFGAVLGWI